MKAKDMPARFWGEEVTTVVFTLNRASIKALMGKTPFEAWYRHLILTVVMQETPWLWLTM